MNSIKTTQNGSLTANKTLPPAPDFDDANTSLPPTQQTSPNALLELDILLRDSPPLEGQESQEVSLYRCVFDGGTEIDSSSMYFH